MIANCHRNPKKKPFEPSDFNPIEIAKRKRSGAITKKAPITVLRDIFVDRKFPATLLDDE